MSLQVFKNLSNVRLFFTNPYIFWMKMRGKINSMVADFIIDPATNRFIEHNHKVWKGYGNLSSTKIVLVDWHSLPLWNIPGLLFASVFARKKGARLCSFSKESWFLARAVHAIYRSCNIHEHIVTARLSKDQRERQEKIFHEVALGLKTKEDVFALNINGCHVGIDIYESYLIEYKRPTVTIDQDLFAVVRTAIGLLIFWEDYFDTHEVAGIVISHDCYIDYNTPCRIAFKRKIPVYLPTAGWVSSLEKYPDQRGYFYSQRKWFQALTEKEQIEARAWAKAQLEKRFQGEVTADMCRIGTTKESAFRSSVTHTRAIRPSTKLKVLICSHCFYDSPHGYGGMIFIDFTEWLKYLVQIAEKTDYDWYLKTHPNPLPGTMENVKMILGPSSRITILPSSTPHQQLAAEGIDVVLTVYGTVGHEYPALGVQVVNAGYNPHAGYDFTWTPKSLKEYEHYLLNLKYMKKDINFDDIYEFYFMYFSYTLVDDLVYHSFRDYMFHLSREDHGSTDNYTYYLDGWDEKRHQETIRRFEEYLDSGKKYLFLKGPVDIEEFGPKDTAYIS